MSCCEHCTLKLKDQQQCEETVTPTQQCLSDLENATTKLNRLELDLQTLNQKYVAEIEKLAQVQHEKEVLEHELEDLCSKLFEEANEMVAVEKKLRTQAEEELKQTKELLLFEQSQLNELRMKLLDNDSNLSYGSSCTSRRGSSKTAEDQMQSQTEIVADQPDDQQQPQQQHDIIPIHPTDTSTATTATTTTIDSFPTPPVSFDAYQLQLFTEYVETVSTNTALSQKKQFQLLFMKLTLLEDIEPCLRFHPHQPPIRKLASKKIIDHLYKETCLIEYVPTKTTTITTTKCSNNKRSCQACNRKQTSLHYRFKLNEQETDWLWIDQYCRDRLVAVCEYFVFLRNIQHGFLNHITSIQDLYDENIRLKLQMFYSRMGALPVILNGSGINFIPASASSPSMKELQQQQQEERVLRSSTSTTHSHSSSSASTCISSLTFSATDSSDTMEDEDIVVASTTAQPSKLPSNDPIDVTALVITAPTTTGQA